MNGDTSVIPKITRPHFASSYQRTDLHNLLDESQSRRLVVVSGPPETGKSTLVSTYIESRKLPSLWYQVDKGDKDLATFFHLLGIAAREATPHSTPAMPHLPQDFTQGITTFAKRYFQDLYRHLEPRFLIVLDNYHEIEEDAALHVAIWVACHELPQGGRIVIITSKKLPLSLARLRDSNMAAIIEPDDLRLSPSKVMPSPLCKT
jgi:LuxR family maltose regulon positive regulatory protein